MSTPAKPAKMAKGHNTRADIQARTEMDKRLIGSQDITCPDDLTPMQREIFETVVAHFIDANIVSAIDSMTLAVFAIALDRLMTIEREINRGHLDPFDSKVTATRAKYESTVWKGCNEFCLSPQARAKLGSVMTAKRKEAADPLMEAMAGD